MPGTGADGGDLDPAVRRIVFGEDEPPRDLPAGEDRGAAGPDGPAPERDEMAVALAAGSVLLAAAIDDEREAGSFRGSYEQREVDPELVLQVRDAVGRLGLPAMGPPPEGARVFIRAVPEEALWSGPDRPSPLLAALCEALSDPELMRLLNGAVDDVRFGAARGAGGARGAHAHAVSVAAEGGADVRAGPGGDGPPATVSCPCGFRSPEPLPARAALTQAAVHVRFGIEERLRLLSLEGAAARRAAVEAAGRIAGGEPD